MYIFTGQTTHKRQNKYKKTSHTHQGFPTLSQTKYIISEIITYNIKYI